MKKIYLIFLILCMLIVICIPHNSYALQQTGGDSSGTYQPDIDSSGLGDLNNYGGTQGNTPKFNTKVNNIVGYLKVIGVSASVIGLIIIGIKYMMGSIEEKAEYKKTLIPYVVGCLLVFTVSILPDIIYKVMTNF